MAEIDIETTAEQAAHDAVEQVLSRVRAKGADAAEVSVSFEAGLSVSARQREVENLEFQNDRGISVTVYLEQRKASVSTSDLSSPAIAAAVDKALYIAGQTEADEYAGLAEPDRMATRFPELELDHSWVIDADAAIEMAIDMEGVALDHDERITNSEGAAVATRRGLSIYANTHGFVGSERRSSHSLSCAVVAADDHGMERDYFYSSARNPERLVGAADIGRTAAERAVARLAPRKIETQDAPVLFRADLATGFFGSLLSAASGGAQYRKASFLLDAVGQTVASELLDIEELPHLPEGAGSASFDAEGVATERRHIVRGGRLEGYILSSYSGRRLGLPTTGNAGGVHNATVSGGGGDFEQMLERLDRGFLVTELMGQGVNLVTGDYSRGAAGFWVENGQVQYPVSEVTIAGNLGQMYRQIIAIGDDVDQRGRIHCGSALIESMKIAGS